MMINVTVWAKDNQSVGFNFAKQAFEINDDGSQRFFASLDKSELGQILINTSQKYDVLIKHNQFNHYHVFISERTNASQST